MSLSGNQLRERVAIELREVREILEGAELIADGLVVMCEHAYRHDHSTSPALAAASACAVALGDAHTEAQRREEAHKAGADR